MLDLLRKKQKSPFIKLAFGVIILSFIIAYAFLGETQQESAVATVNGDNIYNKEYQSAKSNLYAMYKDLYQGQFTPAMERQLNLSELVMNGLIEQSLLVQDAKKRGIKVSKKEIIESISRFGSFQENGVFNKDRYLSVLAYQRLTPEEFEKMQERDLLLQKLQETLRDEVTVGDADLEEEFRQQNEKIDLAFLRFVPAQFETKVKIDETELQAFFDSRKEEYRLPEKVSLRYLLFDPSRYLDEVKIGEEDLARHYRRNIDRFEVLEQVKASHILIRLPQGADEKTRAQKLAQAEKVLAKARAGEDFAKLAKAHSEDPGSAAKGGDLGLFGRGMMVKPFEDAAFALEPNSVSDLVETQYGFHIIRVEAHIPARLKKQEEVTEELKAGVREELARQMALEKALDAFNLNRKEGSLEAAAKEFGSSIEETSLFTREEPVEGLGRSPELTAAAFALKEGELGRPVRLPQGVILFTIKERQESRLPELSAVRRQVEASFRKEKGKELAEEAAVKALAELRDGKSPAEVARNLGGQMEQTGLFSRAGGGFIPKLGASEEILAAAFALTQSAPVAEKPFEIGGGFVVLNLAKRQEADLSKLDPSKRAELRESLLERRKQEALQTKIDELRKKADISIHIPLDKG